MASVALHYKKKKTGVHHCHSVSTPALSHLGCSLTSLLILLIISSHVYQTCRIYFFIFSHPEESFRSLSVYSHVYLLLIILSLSSCSLPGWKEPSVDHKCLAAAGMSPLQALFVWSLCDNCHLVYFWKVCVMFVYFGLCWSYFLFLSNCLWRHQ